MGLPASVLAQKLWLTLSSTLMDQPSLPLTIIITISIMIISWRSIMRFVGHLAYVPWCQAAENLATSLSDNYPASSPLTCFSFLLLLF